jgi:L-malate glycosyltransferase
LELQVLKKADRMSTLRRPRVLILSHTYTVGLNRLKIDAMADRLELEIALVVPPRWLDMLRHNETPAATHSGYTVHALPAYNLGKSFMFFFNPWHLWQLLRTFRPDIVYIEEEPWSLSVLSAALLARLSGRVRFGFFTWENLYRSHHGLGNLIEWWMLRQSDFAIAGNQGAAEVLRRKGFRRPLPIIPQLGLDTELNKPQNESALLKTIGLSKPIIGFAGRLVAEKGVHVLLDALASTPEPFSLLMIGNGPLKDEIAARLAQPPFIGRARLLDSVPHTEVPRYINCMDILVSASFSTPTWVEQYGLVVLTAMSCQVPVGGTACGETPHIVDAGGVVCRENDSADLRAKVQQLLASPALRQQLGQQGRARVIAHHTNAAIAETLNTFLLEISSNA